LCIKLSRYIEDTYTVSESNKKLLLSRADGNPVTVAYSFSKQLLAQEIGDTDTGYYSTNPYIKYFIRSRHPVDFILRNLKDWEREGQLNKKKHPKWNAS